MILFKGTKFDPTFVNIAEEALANNTAAAIELALGSDLPRYVTLGEDLKTLTFKTGVYVIHLVALFEWNNSNNRRIRLTGDDIDDQSPAYLASRLPGTQGSSYLVLERTFPFSCVGNTDIQVEGFQDSGGDLAVSGTIDILKLS